MPSHPSQSIKEKSRVSKEEWREFTKTVWVIPNTRREDHPAIFPDEIPHRLIKLFSYCDDIVLDPFAGTGTTARVALKLGRRATCVEQNGNYVRTIKKECRVQNAVEGNHTLNIFHGDSRDMHFIDDASVGLVVTSPPYWDKANYGKSKSNIGNEVNYVEFLHAVRRVFLECFRVLIPGRKLCVVTANVNQHTEHGLLTFPLAADFTVILRALGYVMVSEIIWSKDGSGGKWGSYGAQRPIFGSYPYPPNFLFKNVHEYILVFTKPDFTEKKGPKVRAYSEVMEGYSVSATSTNTHILNRTLSKKNINTH